MSHTLELDGVIKQYSRDVAVGPVSLVVEEGEFFSLLGPSGCGKTTLLRCISGFESLTAGSIRLGDARLDLLQPNKRDVGLVFQSYALFPHLTVHGNIAFGLKLRKRPRTEIDRRVRDILALVDLTDFAARYPSQLSGGQQQRVAIARSLVLEPQVVLLDEPLSNLDLKLRIQMRRELIALQRRLGKTFLYVTHDQTEALALSDRIAILNKGRLQQVGTPADIYARPASTFVASFIGSSNLIATTGCSNNGAATVLSISGGKVLVSAHRPPEGVREPKAVIRPERIALSPLDGGPMPVNAFPATVVSKTFLGEDVHLSLVVGDTPMLASLKNLGWASSIAKGDIVRATIDPEDVLLVPEAAD